MNYEQILALLIAKFTGVRKDGLTALARVIAIQATSEDDAKTRIDAITDAQVNGFVKGFRADVDKEVSESNKTYEQTLKKKFDFVEKKTEPGGGNGGGTGGNDDMAALIAAAVAKAVEPLTTKIASFETDNIAKTRLQQLNEKLAECKDETFKSQTLKDFGRMTFADDAAFTEYLNEKVADIATANQNHANDGLRSAGAPMFNQKGEDGVSKAVSQYVQAQKPENNPFAGREV